MQRSGHLQTIYAGLGDFSVVNPVVYDRQVVCHYHTNHRLIHLRRQLLQTKDGGTLSGYLV